jgi:hypothetical protein
MKKRLLKPPQKQKEILLLPEPQAFGKHLRASHRISTCHQLSFFHPGIAVRYVFLDLLRKGKKKCFFIDTDKTDIQVRIPIPRQIKETIAVEFLKSDQPLCFLKNPDWDSLRSSFRAAEKVMQREMGVGGRKVLQNMKGFENIFLEELKGLSLKERLAEGFLRFHGIKVPYIFYSDIAKSEEFREFFLTIYRDDKRFRTLYNKALEEYKQQFRFRYRNFPFPKLQGDELPFWILHEGKRFQFRKGDVSASEIPTYTILPKASPLTLFLRLHMTDVFIHGVGGANYEWVNERIIEGFFHTQPPLYSVMSATFYIDDIPERDYPFFFIDPEIIRQELVTFMKKNQSELL